MERLKSTPANLLSSITSLLNDSGVSDGFRQYVKQKSLHDDTWKFWAQFVLEDCFAYISLYMAIRHKNWKLRLSSLKMNLLAQLFPEELIQSQTAPNS